MDINRMWNSTKHRLQSLSAVLFALVFALLGGPIAAQSRESAGVRSVDWSPDRSRIAVSTREGLTVYDDSFYPLTYLPFPDDINFNVPSATFSPDGTHILLGNQILDSSTLQTVQEIDDYILPYSGQWSPDGTEVAFFGGSDRELRIYSALDGLLLRTFSTIEWAAGAEGNPLWSPDGRHFSVIAGRNAFYIVDAVNGTQLVRHEITADAYNNWSASWSPDSSKLAFGVSRIVPIGTPNSTPMADNANNAQVWSTVIFDVTAGEIVREIPVASIGTVWNPDNTQIALSQHDEVTIWNIDTGEMIARYPRHPGGLMVYSPSGGQLMIAYPSMETLHVPSIFSSQQIGAGGVINSLTPDVSLERLQSITEMCSVPLTVEQQLDTAIAAGNIASVIAQVEALPAGEIPAACAADLIAVARELVGQENRLDAP